MFQFWFNTYFVTEEGFSLAANGSSDLLCKMGDNPKSEPTRVKR